VVVDAVVDADVVAAVVSVAVVVVVVVDGEEVVVARNGKPTTHCPPIWAVRKGSVNQSQEKRKMKG